MATQFGTYSLADIAAQLKGCDAYVAGRGSRPIIGDDEFTRYWTIDHALIERARSFADLYGDGDTFNADTPEVHHHVIVDPAAEQGVAQLGTWRVVRNFEDPDQKGKLFQTLRKGYLLPPTPPEEGGDVSWTALDAEARIWRVNEVDATLAEMLVPHYVILYPHVAKTHVHEFCAALLARPDIEDPVFDEHPALAGTYKFSVVKNEEQDDGTSYVFAVIVSTEVPAGKEVQIYDGCAVAEWATFFFMLPTLPTCPVSESGIDYRLEGIAFDKELGLWECRIVRSETKTLTVPLHEVERSASDVVSEQQFLNVREGDKDHTGESIALQAMTFVVGIIKSRRRKKNPNCTQDIVEQSRAALPQDTGWVECVTRHGTAYTRTWSNQEAGFGEALDFDGGSNNSLSTRLNAFGLEDGSASKTPYEGHGENDAVPVGWETRDLVTIQTRYEGDQKRECTVTEYYRYYSLRSSAENGIDSLITELSEEANKASSANISVVTLRTGQRRYRAQVRTTPTFGEWGNTIPTPAP